MSPRAVAPPSADTRQRILDIATGLFRDRGYAGTSIRDIADGLGMTKAALYYHFTCKEDVLEALVAPTVAAIEEFLAQGEVNPGTDPAELLGRFVDILGCTSATLATALGDPAVLRSEAGRFRLADKQARLVDLIAGPGADEARQLRARAALGAVKATMETLAPICADVQDPLAAQRNLARHRETIVAAAVGALQG